MAHTPNLTARPAISLLMLTLQGDQPGLASRSCLIISNARGMRVQLSMASTQSRGSQVNSRAHSDVIGTSCLVGWPARSICILSKHGAIAANPDPTIPSTQAVGQTFGYSFIAQDCACPYTVAICSAASYITIACVTSLVLSLASP
ncbi:hypothetical protein F5Y08DRAFT_310315 [Xylaria arbuscula]|nr:hypothetical protein F5Y08DRAFT_310315 [Xylaria arbuscula]